MCDRMSHTKHETRKGCCSYTPAALGAFGSNLYVWIINLMHIHPKESNYCIYLFRSYGREEEL